MNPKRFRLVIATGVLVATVVVALPGTARSAFPGANGKIAFASERDFNFQIYVIAEH